MTAVELAPIVKTLELRQSPQRAFDAFAGEVAAWWPLNSHSRGLQEAGEQPVDVQFQPRVGGRIYERLADGRELDWGEVLTWQPGVALAFTWHLGGPPEQATQVAVRFDALDGGGCRVTLTHSGWERLGEAGIRRHDGYDSGWDRVFGACYGRHVRAA